MLVKVIPIESLVLTYIPQQGDLIQKTSSKGLENISIARNEVPNFEFNCIKLFLIDSNIHSLTTTYLLLDVSEEGRELHRVLSMNDEFLVLEHLVSKVQSRVEKWQTNPNFHCVVGEITNPYILKKILEGELVSEEQDISPLIEEERQLNIKLTKEWLDNPTNQKILLHRAKEIDKKIRNTWFNLTRFCDNFKVTPSRAIDELNLLKLGGHLVARYNDSRQEEQYLVVFTDKQRLNKLDEIERDLKLRLKEIEDQRKLILLKQN